jgi:hypothetical protein
MISNDVTLAEVRLRFYSLALEHVQDVRSKSEHLVQAEMDELVLLFDRIRDRPRPFRAQCRRLNSTRLGQNTA